MAAQSAWQINISANSYHLVQSTANITGLFLEGGTFKSDLRMLRKPQIHAVSQASRLEASPQFLWSIKPAHSRPLVYIC